MGRPRIYRDDTSRVRAFRLGQQIQQLTAKQSRDNREREQTIQALNALLAAEPVWLDDRTEPGTIQDGMQLHILNSHLHQLQLLHGKLSRLTSALCYAHSELPRLRGELATCLNPVT